MANFLVYLSVHVPFVFLPEAMGHAGLNPGQQSQVMMVTGVSNAVGRLVMGAVANAPFLSAVALNRWNCYHRALYSLQEIHFLILTYSLHWVLRPAPVTGVGVAKPNSDR